MWVCICVCVYTCNDFSYVSYQMREAPTDACCGGDTGGDTVAPIASLGHGVWQLGQDVRDAEVAARPQCTA